MFSPIPYRSVDDETRESGRESFRRQAGALRPLCSVKLEQEVVQGYKLTYAPFYVILGPWMHICAATFVRLPESQLSLMAPAVNWILKLDPVSLHAPRGDEAPSLSPVESEAVGG
ncbi:hypothetical protein PM082_004571 [Marasmius tenuissimus]|nr:hypothetical protein PM082_004571 [Marasmius tenuissimus]